MCVCVCVCGGGVISNLSLLSLLRHRRAHFSSEAVVDWLGKTRIFMFDCPPPLRGYMNRHCEEIGCSFQTLAGRSPIGYNMALFNAITYTFYHHDQSRPPWMSSGAVGMTMLLRSLFLPSMSLSRGSGITKCYFSNENALFLLCDNAEMIFPHVGAFLFKRTTVCKRKPIRITSSYVYD